MGRRDRDRGQRKRSRKSKSRRFTRRQLLSAGIAALGGGGLLIGTQGYSLVEASRSGEVEVATGENAAIKVDIPPFVVSDHKDVELVTVTNQTTHQLTFEVDLESPAKGTVSPASTTIGPTESATFYVTVEEGNPSEPLPFTIHADNGNGFSVSLPRSTRVFGLLRYIRDRSKNNNARYNFSYRIDGFPEFAELTIDFNNLDKSWATQSFTSTSRKDRITFSKGGAMNTTYEIAWTGYDANGAVLFQNSITDKADGTNPPDNDDLRTPDDPSLKSFTVTDTSRPSWDQTKYTVDYEVANLDRFQRVDVIFNDTDQDWATTTKENTSAPTGSVSYSQGGTAGDEYQITVEVINDDGFVVDRGTVTDVSDGNGTISYP